MVDPSIKFVTISNAPYVSKKESINENFEIRIGKEKTAKESEFKCRQNGFSFFFFAFFPSRDLSPRLFIQQ
jgi:hypothetical protein